MRTPSEMKDKLQQLSEDERFISGIYNYCDRWCERCSFTSRCMNYSFEKDAPPADGPEIWDYLQNVFEATSLMLDEIMVKMGIHPPDLEIVSNTPDFDTEKHSLLLMAGKITSEMHEWLEQNSENIKHADARQTFNKKDKKEFDINDAVEVINWYIFFTPAKIARALSGLRNEDIISEHFDADGSAKIALIAIDRLIASWTVIMNALPALEDEVLKILIDLSSLRKQTEIVFPNARLFVRPGFDE